MKKVLLLWIGLICFGSLDAQDPPYLELGSWEYGEVGSNKNLEGPVLKVRLPRWKADHFILRLEVEGHPEYDSEYNFLLSD